MSTSEKPAPLQGVKVIELGGLIAGPYAASLFAQFGAEVIKVETPDGGDPLRRWRKLHNGTSLWWYSLSRNKKSITLNLKSEQGRRIVRALVEKADVVIENFRPGVLEGWGLGWDELSRINPGLVLVRISGYGQDGPYRDRPGFAAIAEAIGGLRYVTGDPDRAPVRAGVSLGDTLAALYAVVGALIALHHRNVNGGQGQVVDAALYESVFAVMESLIPEYSRFGFVRERSGASLPGISPSNTYTCRDGGYVVIGGNSDGIFKRLMLAVGRPDLAGDPTLTHNDGRVEKSDMIDAAISGWTSRHSLDDVLSALQAAEVPVGKIYTAADIHQDPHYRARGMIEPVVLPDGQAIDLPGIVPRLSETPGRTAWVGPALGAHAGGVLATLGFDAGAVDALRKARVI
ncbi:MAG: CoA transferase [Acidobacteria bacterium]|nr:CoA transferase [Acidobacteriota bacterium]